jgi:hypothetical protein
MKCSLDWVERADQRADGLLVAPEKNESVSSTIQPGPPPRVAQCGMTAAPETRRCRHPIGPEMIDQADLRQGTSIDTRSL